MPQALKSLSLFIQQVQLPCVGRRQNLTASLHVTQMGVTYPYFPSLDHVRTKLVTLCHISFLQKRPIRAPGCYCALVCVTPVSYTHLDVYKRQELLVLENTVWEWYSIHKSSKLVEERGFVVCRLSLYLYELSPVELIWSQVKQDVTKHSVKFKESLSEGLINNTLSHLLYCSGRITVTIQ